MSATTVALVDSGGTNIGSVTYALERLGARAAMTSDPATITAADRVVLPGVGAAGAGMRRLQETGLADLLRGLEQPLLGVCLGMQLLFERSDEDGGVDCLGLIPGAVIEIPAAPGARVPHMGWNTLDVRRADPILTGIGSGDRAYFVHGYAAPVGPATLAGTEHNGWWSAVVRSDNRWGVQFHPERSADVGARLLRNFLGEVTGG
ncbi:MAG: imidazole glycerol phosphate synthase subunit HisH [Actinobacteria bacterium]|nr:imidazole glycerol phosphate synthase subunit HisH [Actinomycetota bacterium]